MASDSIDGLLAERSSLRLTTDAGMAGVEQFDKVKAQEAAYTSAGGYDVPQAPETPPAPQDVPYPTPPQPAPRVREKLPEWITQGDRSHGVTNLESPSEAVRNRQTEQFNFRLSNSLETGARQAAAEIDDILAGRKPGFLSSLGGKRAIEAIDNALGLSEALNVAGLSGLDHEKTVRIIEAVLLAFNLPSTTTGLVTADVLKQAGVDPERADAVGQATTVVSSILWPVVSGGGIGTLKDLRATLPPNAPVVGDGETLQSEVEVTHTTGAETEAK